MVYIKSLNKNIFPLILNPEEDELFSSWIRRLAHNHLIQPNNFINIYLNQNINRWGKEIDISPSEKLLSLLENRTLLTNNQIINLFLDSYEGITFINERVTSIARHFTTAKKGSYGQLFCPSCLGKNIPYIKKSWRLIYSILCEECNNYLLDRCPKCGTPLSLSNQNTGQLPTDFVSLNFCRQCSFDLGSISQKNKPTYADIQYQHFINDSIKKGYNNFSLYSFTYFRSLLILSKNLRGTRKDNRLRKIVYQEFGWKETPLKEDIRCWSINDRKETLVFANTLLQDLTQLKAIFKKGRVIKSTVIQDFDYVPYWFENLFC